MIGDRNAAARNVENKDATAVPRHHRARGSREGQVECGRYDWAGERGRVAPFIEPVLLARTKIFLKGHMGLSDWRADSHSHGSDDLETQSRSACSRARTSTNESVPLTRTRSTSAIEASREEFASDSPDTMQMRPR